MPQRPQMRGVTVALYVFLALGFAYFIGLGLMHR
jgi:hypothetical protein